MTRRRLSVLQVSSTDGMGGAAGVARRLTNGLIERGHEAWLAVGQKRGEEANVLLIPDDDRPPYAITGYTAIRARLARAAARHPRMGLGFLARALRAATHPGVIGSWARGSEDFEFPGTYRLLDLPPQRAQIVHCHNLHGGYFDLRALAWLSREVPTVLTLHDSWLLTGHCAHSFDCARWQTGCGECPDLGIYPSIRVDRTAENWQRKRDIFAESRLHLATPCEWLMDRVRHSMLAPSIASARVIPNGVDLGVFAPGDRLQARRRAGIPADAWVILFRADALIGGDWIDRETWRAALPRIEPPPGRSRLLFLGVGGDAPPSSIGTSEVRFLGYLERPEAVADVMRAADILVHPSLVDTFPSLILEALACGLPIVATNVCGIPEQVRSLTIAEGSSSSPLEDATGVLVPARDPRHLARSVSALLGDDMVRMKLGANAAVDAQARFGLDRQVDSYLQWYGEILGVNSAQTVTE